MEAIAGGVEVSLMSTNLKAAVESYLRARTLSRGTRNEYFSTLRKWEQWGRGGPIEELRRKDIREFLDWVYERAVADEGMLEGGLMVRTVHGILNNSPTEVEQRRTIFGKPLGPVVRRFGLLGWTAMELAQASASGIPLAKP